MESLGFELLAITIKTLAAQFVFPVKVWVRKGTINRAVIFVSGYGQKHYTWRRYLKSASPEVQQSTIIVLEKSRRSSWATYQGEQNDIADLFSALIYTVLNSSDKIYLVGHSMGGALCRHLAVTFPETINGVLQLCPVPDKPRSILWNKRFWKNGGIRALFAALWTLVAHPYKGFKPPFEAVPGLFTGVDYPQDLVHDYWKDLATEGVWTFFWLTLAYKGEELAKATKQGWNGTNIVVATDEDNIIDLNDVRQSARMTPNGKFHLIHGAPHCLNFANNEVWDNKVAPVLELAFRELFSH